MNSLRHILMVLCPYLSLLSFTKGVHSLPSQPLHCSRTSKQTNFAFAFAFPQSRSAHDFACDCRCGSPRPSTTSPAHPSCTGNASNSLGPRNASRGGAVTAASLCPFCEPSMRMASRLSLVSSRFALITHHVAVFR